MGSSVCMEYSVYYRKTEYVELNKWRQGYITKTLTQHRKQRCLFIIKVFGILHMYSFEFIAQHFYQSSFVQYLLLNNYCFPLSIQYWLSFWCFMFPCVDIHTNDELLLLQWVGLWQKTFFGRCRWRCWFYGHSGFVPSWMV